MSLTSQRPRAVRHLFRRNRREVRVVLRGIAQRYNHCGYIIIFLDQLLIMTNLTLPRR